MAVASHGYASITVAELTQLAGVSQRAFSERFDSVEACFLATHDVIVHDALSSVRAAYDRHLAGPADAVRAVLGRLLELICGDPRAATLVLLTPQSAGAPAIAHAEDELVVLEGMLNEGFARHAPRSHASELTAKAIASGIRKVLADHLQRGQLGRLARRGDALSDWVLCYCSAALTVHDGTPACSVGARGLQGYWRQSAAEMPERERILRAVAALSSGEGGQPVDVSAVLSRADVSPQTFSEHFGDAHEAFLASYEQASRRALGLTLGRFQAAGSWPQAVHWSLAALLELLASEPDFARLAFVEVLAAGPAAAEQVELRFEAFAALLDPGYVHCKSPPTRVVAHAVAGGIWGVIQYHVVRGLTQWLPSAVPALTAFALTPFIGAERASAIASEPLNGQGTY